MQKSHTQVDFIGIGFPRCGTTWLGKCLEEHPEICFSKHKEVHFFDLEYHYEKGRSFYESHFVCADGERVTGEYTPEYIREPEKCAARIHEMYPDAKLLVVMRDPVWRAFSHYRYRKYKASLYQSFQELIDNVDTDAVVAESRYIEKLEPFLRRFSQEQMLFLIHEESSTDPHQYIKKLYTFLGVDNTFVPPSLTQPINVTNARGMRYRSVEQALNRLRWSLRGSYFGRLLIAPFRALGFTKLITWFREYNKVPVTDPEQLSKEQYQTLWQHFAPSVQLLEDRIGLPTSAYWGDYDKK